MTSLKRSWTFEAARPPFELRLSWTPVVVPLLPGFLLYMAAPEREGAGLLVLFAAAIAAIATALHVWTVNGRLAEIERRLSEIKGDRAGISTLQG